MSKILFRGKDHIEPSFEERKKAATNFPSFSRLGFEKINDIENVFSRTMTLEEVKKKSDLYYWDMCLFNKLFYLKESYINLMVNYNRGVPSDLNNPNESTDINGVNHFLFSYYTETIYFFHFSIREYIYQILNVYFDLELTEIEVTINNVFEKLSVKMKENNENKRKNKGNGIIINEIIKTNKTIKAIKVILEKYNKASKKTNNIRNEFTHTYPSSLPDLRASIGTLDQTIKIDNTENMKIQTYKTYRRGTGKHTKPSEFIEDINKSLKVLETFIKELKTELI